jgi:hypothetical protein
MSKGIPTRGGRRKGAGRPALPVSLKKEYTNLKISKDLYKKIRKQALNSKTSMSKLINKYIDNDK